MDFYSYTCVFVFFRNHYINFTLFFFEEEATSSDIINVIESSAPKVQKDSTNVALVDKFELELDSVKVTMERQVQPETFNKKVSDPAPPPPPPAPPRPPQPEDTETNKPVISSSKPSQIVKATLPQKTTTTKRPMTVSSKKKMPEEEPG